MTVCIAAIADKGKHIVAAADRMTTVGPPLNVEFEPPLSKIEVMGNTCVAMGAGNALFIGEVFQRARSSYQNLGAVTVDQIATSVKDTYSKYRDEKIEEQIIRPFLGPDFNVFRTRGGTLAQYLQPQGGIYQQIVVQMSQFNLGIELIVAGIDAVGTHLYYVGHPGTLVPFDRIGYNAVGSGATHVAIKFALDCQHPALSLEDVLLAAYAAKKASEVAPGVGQETEMKVISGDGIWTVPRPLLDVLAKSHSESTKKSKPNADEIKAKYAELRKNA